MLFALYGSAYAEEKKPGQDQAGTVAADAPANETVMPVIEVTARHGKEDAKEVPFGLSVLSGTDIESRRLYDLDTVLGNVPGVDLNTSNGSNIRIRGVGSLYRVSRDDSSVVLNIDGVSMSANYLNIGSLDVKRIEVLKGPQGTLFGRSSGAGAINIITNKPTDYFEGHISAEYGQDNQRQEEMVLSGPLADGLSARFAIRDKGSDSWITNQTDGQPLSNPSSLQFRGSLLWEPAAGTSALLTAERQEDRQLFPATLLKPYGDSPSVRLPVGYGDDNKLVIERYSLELNHDLAASRLTSITALTRMDNLVNKAYDTNLMRALYGGSAYLATDTMSEDVVSQELRWQSLPEADVFWVGGLNYFQSKRSFDFSDHLTKVQNDHDFKTTSYALYGEVTYPLTERLKLTGGLRQTWDQKHYDATYNNASGSTPDRRKLDESHSTGRTALSYAVTPQTNIYGTLAVGSKPGGFNDNATGINDSEPYKAADIYTAEFGFKSELPDSGLSLNGALFFNKTKDDHLLNYDYQTHATYAMNVDTRSYGAELEGRWRVNDHWNMSAAVAYLDAEITSSVLGLTGGDVASGNRVPDVPRWSGNLNVSYTTPLPAFLGMSAPRFETQLNYRLVGKRPADPQNHFDLDSYGKLDMRIGIINRGLELYVWGDNLLDEHYDLYGYYFTSTVQVGTPSRGRSVGAGVKWYF